MEHHPGGPISGWLVRYYRKSNVRPEAWQVWAYHLGRGSVQAEK